MTTLPEKGEGIFGYKIMDRTTVSMLGAQITEFSARPSWTSQTATTF